MAKTYKAGEIGHLGEHNRMSQFIEDAEQGKIPELIGPEGPQGPPGPDGPPGENGEDGQDGKTPEVLHQSWDQILMDGERTVVFNTDPQADIGNGFDPGNVSVHLNGVLQRSGSQGEHDAYRDASGNLKFNYALEDGDFIVVQSFGS